MASVSERGQLLLITGLALAISLVAIALVLNSAIYTHNLASRYDSPADEVVMMNEDAVNSAGSQIQYANDEYAGASYSTIDSNYQSGVADVESEMGSDAAIDGAVYRVNHAGSTEGLRITGVAPDGNGFRSRQGATDWTVVGEGQVRSFRSVVLTSNTVTEGTSTVLTDILGTSQAFVIAFDDDSDSDDEWRIAIYEDGDTVADDISVTVQDVEAGTFSTCSVADTRVEIDFTGARLDDEACAPLLFVRELSAPYNVRFVNAENVAGSYRLVVDDVVDGAGVEEGPFTDRVDTINAGDHCSGPTFYANGDGYPHISPALYAAELETTYDTEDVSYAGTHRVAPGEYGSAAGTPRVTKVDVGDASSGDDTFSVDWAVDDPDGDLATVELFVDGASVASVPVSGSSADPPATTVSGSGSSTYEITVTVTDAAGNSRSVTQLHADDGDSSGGCPP